MSHRCGSPRGGAAAQRREHAALLLLVLHAVAVRVKGEPVLRFDVVSVCERGGGRGWSVTEGTECDLVVALAAGAW